MQRITQPKKRQFYLSRSFYAFLKKGCLQARCHILFRFIVLNCLYKTDSFKTSTRYKFMVTFRAQSFQIAKNGSDVYTLHAYIGDAC